MTRRGCRGRVARRRRWRRCWRSRRARAPNWTATGTGAPLSRLLGFVEAAAALLLTGYVRAHQAKLLPSAVRALVPSHGIAALRTPPPAVPRRADEAPRERVQPPWMRPLGDDADSTDGGGSKSNSAPSSPGGRTGSKMIAGGRGGRGGGGGGGGPSSPPVQHPRRLLPPPGGASFSVGGLLQTSRQQQPQSSRSLPTLGGGGQSLLQDAEAPSSLIGRASSRAFA